jgi:hypothetical protein
MRNDVWDIMLRSKGESVVSSRWFYKIKHDADGSIENFKVRFVVRGFSHREGVEYEETFPLVTRCFYLRCYLYCFSYEVEDSPCGCEDAFLNYIIEEEVYIDKP